MIEIQRILLPTDFSDYSSEAESYAGEFAERFGAELHLLHVVESPATVMLSPGDVLPADFVDEQERSARQSLDELFADWTPERPPVRSVRHGAPFVEIIGYARENGIDLIVMATHGRTGLSHALLGSVAERVIRKAPCPVLTVRPEQHRFVLP